MNIVKMVGMIFLGVYLILTGLATMSEAVLSQMTNNFIQLFGATAGVLILIAIGRFVQDKEGKR